MYVIAGDIGGTKTWLAIVARQDGAFVFLREQRFDSQKYPDFNLVVDEFLAAGKTPPLHSACFAVAGPVESHAGMASAQVTNLPWHLDSAALAARLHVAQVRLVNDFQAVARGIALLADEDFTVLHNGLAAERSVAGGTVAVIGAGTGLGHAVVVKRAGDDLVLPSEAGHIGFAPENEEQRALLEYWAERLQQDAHSGWPAPARVTPEHFLSGAGLARIFEFQQFRLKLPVHPDLFADMHAGDPAVAISRYGLSGTDKTAEKTLDLFAELYGSQAANLALICLASRVYIAGGIAPKILPKLKAGGFMRAFLHKAPMAHLLERALVCVVMNEKAALLGAARVAMA